MNKKLLAKIVLGIWISIVIIMLSWALFTKPEAVLFGILFIGGLLFMIFGPFWAIEKLSEDD